jgi:hypothetical protein
MQRGYGEATAEMLWLWYDFTAKKAFQASNNQNQQNR